MADAYYDLKCKIGVLGDPGVGKTAFVNRFAYNKYLGDYAPVTVGLDYAHKDIWLHGKTIRVGIWDPSGQERFSSVTPNFYRGVQGFIIVCDVTRKPSFRNIFRWLDELDKYASVDADKLIVGNKSDLVNERRVTYNEGKIKADFHGIPYREISAKNADNVDVAIETMVASIMSRIATNDDNGVTRNANNRGEIRTGCCHSNYVKIKLPEIKLK